MFGSFGNALFKRPQPTSPTSSDSSVMGSKSADTGITISIGYGDAAQPFHIAPSAMKACIYLQQNLEDGSNLPYVDPKAFQAAIDFLGMDVIGRASRADSTAFNSLFEDGDAMLNFAKTWALGHEFKLPHLQNKLVDAYSRWYAELLSTRTYIRPSAKAFAWLRDTIANHTPAEKFLVDFAAGMRRFNNVSPDESILDTDIAGYIENRWSLLKIEGDTRDRILNYDPVFKLARTDKHIQVRTLKIIPPPKRPRIPPALLKPPVAARSAPSASPRTVRLLKSNNSSLLSFPPPDTLDGETRLKEESGDDDSVDFSRFPATLRERSSSWRKRTL